LEEITHARTEAKMRKIASVETKCREDGTFALEMLSRAYPEEYGRKDRITVDANVDAKVATTSDIVMGLSPEAVARYRANRDSILGKTKKA
jgi:hypothetical protein